MPHMLSHPRVEDRLWTASPYAALGPAAHTLCDDLQQRTLCCRDHRLQLEIFDDPTTGGKITRMTFADRFRKVKYGSRQPARVSRRHYPTARADQIRSITNRGDDARQTAGHRFADNIGKAFAERRGQAQYISGMIYLVDLPACRSPDHMIAYTQGSCHCFQASDNGLRSVADDQADDMPRGPRRDRDRLQERWMVLHRIEPRHHRNDERRWGASKRRPRCSALLRGRWAKLVGIDAINDGRYAGRLECGTTSPCRAAPRIGDYQIRQVARPPLETNRGALEPVIALQIQWSAPHAPDQRCMATECRSKQ